MIKEWWTNIIGQCERCKTEDAVFYNDNGELLCSDCLFDDEISDRMICQDCGADIPNDGCCWYCENIPDCLDV